MATMRVFQALLIPLLLFSFSLLLSSSFASDRDEKRCARECRGIPETHDRRDCERRCLTRQRETEEKQGREREEEKEGEEGEEEEWGRGGRRHPYYFGHESYEDLTSTPHGRFQVLERFTKKSDLLAGIDNFRLAILEAEPKTFIIPSHFDAEEVFYVIQGRGVITLQRPENRESYEIKKGDIMRIPAGLIVYAINNHNERLRIAMLLQPISTPGHFEEFIGAGGRNPETFYTAFSTGVLEAAFNRPKGALDRVFGSQRKGEIIRASEEQLRELAQSASQGSDSGYSSERSRKPHNILDQKPSCSNDHGELYEAKIDDYEPLRDLDVDVSIANISEGSMMAPNYNSRATKVAFVLGGQGEVEMACPHITGERSHGYRRGEEEEDGRRRQIYKRVRSRLSPGSVFVIPAGHPVALIASGRENLQVLCFGIRADKNEKFYLAGRNNVLNKLERIAKQLSFAAPSEEVDRVLRAQDESVFLPGPEWRRRRQGEREGILPLMES